MSQCRHEFVLSISKSAHEDPSKEAQTDEQVESKVNDAPVIKTCRSEKNETETTSLLKETGTTLSTGTEDGFVVSRFIKSDCQSMSSA